MKANPIVVVGLGYLLLQVANKAYGAKQLNYFIAKVSWTFPTLFITIGVQNPSSADFTIRSFTGTLFANDDEVANVSSFNLTRIKSNAQTFFVVAVRLSLLETGMHLWEILNGAGGISQTLKLTGTVNVENVPVPVSLTYKLF